MGEAAAKVCAYCGANCADKPRTKDEAGRYYCRECFPKAKAAAKTVGVASAGAARPAAAEKAPVVGVFDDPILLDPQLVGEVPGVGGGKQEPKQAKVEQPQAVQPKSCPSCGVLLPGDAVVCTNCGFNSATGKGLKTKIERARAAKVSGGLSARGSGSGDYAGALHRFLAALIDGVILLIVSWVVMFAVGASGVLGEADPEAWAKALEAGEYPTALVASMLISIGLNWAYYALQEGSGKQATVGKGLMGFSCATVDGQPVGLLRASARFWIKAIGVSVPGLNLLYLLACLLCVLLTPRRQMPHDMITGVVMTR